VHMHRVQILIFLLMKCIYSRNLVILKTQIKIVWKQCLSKLKIKPTERHTRCETISTYLVLYVVIILIFCPDKNLLAILLLHIRFRHMFNTRRTNLNSCQSKINRYYKYNIYYYDNVIF